jgi:hypothetical protein
VGIEADAEGRGPRPAARRRLGRPPLHPLTTCAKAHGACAKCSCKMALRQTARPAYSIPTVRQKYPQCRSRWLAFS